MQQQDNNSVTTATLPGDLLTVGDIAAMCGVAPRTVHKWCDSGALKSHRMPASMHRRVVAADLADFLRGQQVALPATLSAPPAPVLLATPDTDLADDLLSLVTRGGSPVAVAANAYELGKATAERRWRVALLDVALGRPECSAAVTDLEAGGCRVVVLLGEDGGDSLPGSHPSRRWTWRPVRAESLAEMIEREVPPC